jgi:MFS family permease
MTPITASVDVPWHERHQKWLAVGSAYVSYTLDICDWTILLVVGNACLGELLGTADAAVIAWHLILIGAIKFFAWLAGGPLFGWLGDKIGRPRAMLATIVMYSGFTGLSAQSANWQELAFWQALASMAVAGEYGPAGALVNETLRGAARKFAAALVASSFASGFLLAASAYSYLGHMGWRFMFVVGVGPALIVIPIRLWVRNPQVHETERGAAGFRDLFAAPHVRHATFSGVVLSSAMMLSSWGIINMLGPWASFLAAQERIAGFRASDLWQTVMIWGCIGYFVYAAMASWFTTSSREQYALWGMATFIVSILLAFFGGSFQVFTALAPYWGFFTMGMFAFPAWYLAELYPSRIRSTGMGTCFAVGRLFTGIGMLVQLPLVKTYGNAFGAVSLATTLILLVGIAYAWFWATETGGKLPEER